MGNRDMPHRQIRLLVLMAVIVVSHCACSSSDEGPGKQLDRRTPVEYFKQQQMNTITPNGKIMLDTVEELDGRINYKTEDGKQWSVSYSKRADSTYQYGTPDEVRSRPG